MSEFLSLSFEEVLDRIASPANTLILFHRGPDADAVGSAFALKKVLTDLGSHAWCVCANEVPDRLLFLTDGKQESVLPEAIPSDFNATRIISVDTASPSQLGTLWDLYADRIDLMIDHHGMGEPYADHYIHPEAAATGELMFDLVKKLATDGQVEITDELCINLYAAISSDTGCFKYSNVTPLTHMAAASLVRSGIDAAEINRLLFDAKSQARLKAERIGLENLKTCCDGRVAIIALDYDEITDAGVDTEELDAFIDVARCVDGVEVAFAVKQHEKDGRFRVSMRSNGNVDVSEICALFGGGGHAKAAGCGIDENDKLAVVEKILRAVLERI